MSGWSSFLEVEPLTGRRHVEASEQRTRQGWARWIRSMLTERYPQTERVVLVLDNLNTHGIVSLYASYPPEQAPGAGRAARNPLHAQARQLVQHRRDRVERPGRPMPRPVDRWMPNLATVRHQMRVWEQHRNNREVTVD